MSVSCALWATSLHQWARRYIRLTQPERCSPEKRARMRAYFANGAEKMHISWAVEGLPTLLHLSLFLFFTGLAIFLFNVHQEVFICVVSWIGLFSVVYGLITLLPLIWQDSPYYSPLTIPAWFLYASIQYATFTVLASIANYYSCYQTWVRFDDLRDRYRGWMLRGMEKRVERTASERSSNIDIGVLGWTISALGDDDSLEKFFEALPGFFNSKLVDDFQENLPFDISRRLSDAMNGFLCRTLSSNVIDSVKHHRLHISMSAISSIRISGFPSIIGDVFFDHWDQVPPTVEIGHTLERWCNGDDQRTARYAQGIISRVLATVRERDDRWVELAARVYDLPEHDIRDIVTDGDDSVSLAILIHLCRNAFRSDPLWGSLGTFTDFDIGNTLSGLQHDFCTLWNEIVQEAMNQGPYTTPVGFLNAIRHHYIALHQGTDASPTAFFPAWMPSSYPSCDIASHRPDSKHNEIGDSSQPPAATSPVPTGSRPTDVPPPVDATLQDIPPAATLPHLLEGTTQQDIVAPCAVSEILSAASTLAPTPTLAPIPASTAPALNESLESHDAGFTSTSNPLLPASSVVGLSIPVSPPPSHVPPSPNAESLAPLNRTIHSHPTGNVTLPRLRSRGLVNIGDMSFTNAVLQLLVRSPPFWNLIRELGDLKGQRGAGSPETGGVATLLVDATAKFCDEFVYKDELSVTQQLQQNSARGKARENEEGKKEPNDVDSFNPRYMYDVMKEMRRLKDLLVRFRTRMRPSVTDSCWLNTYRMANSRMRKSFSASTSTRSMQSCLLLSVVTSWLLLHPE